MSELYSILLLHVIESTFWVILFLLLTWLFRIRDSRMRCWICRISLIKFFIPTTVFSAWISLKASHELLPAFAISAEPVKSAVHYTANQPAVVWPVYFWSVGGLAFVTLAILTGVRSHRRIRMDNTPFVGRYRSFLQRTLNQVGLSENEIDGMLIEYGPSIALYGIFRPRIIAKHAFLETLNDNELASALQHEAAHWIRRDNLWRLLTDVITAVFWFHPVVWFIRNRLTLETEKACDEIVLSFGRMAGSYANCLLKAAEFSREKNHFGAIALSETSFKQRISHVIHYKKEEVSNMKNSMKKSAVILTCLTLFGWSFIAFANPTPWDEDYVFEYLQLDVPPKTVLRVAPIYPPELKKERIMGTVNVVFIIDENGNVIEPTIESSTNNNFNEATIKGLSQWKFEPGISREKPVKTRARLPFSYALREPKKKE